MYLGSPNKKMERTLAEQILPHFKPHTPPLSFEETQSCLKEKMVAYPSVLRSKDDHLSSDYVLLSFLQSPEGSYVKVRGVSDSLEGCKKIATQIFQKIDSCIPIAISKMGEWCFVTNNPEKISQRQFKVIDEKMITHSENVEMLKKEVENNLKKQLNEDETSLKNRIESLKDYNEDTLKNYIRQKVMLFENEQQLNYAKKKVALFTRKKFLLACLLMKQSERYDMSWFEDYKKELSAVGSKPTEVTEDAIKRIQEEIDFSSEERDVAELQEELASVNAQLNDLKL